jgi:Carboxypeptidase regulatory-like domain
MQSRWTRLFFLCVLLLSFAGHLRADVTGEVSGTLHDNSGAAIPGASVTITDASTNISQTAVSDAQGQYTFLALPPGHYKISASANGFQAQTINNIDLKVNDRLRYDVTLAVGSVTQNVQVEANTVQVQTENTSLGGTIESNQMLALPLNGRSYLDLLSLQAGVAPAPSSAAATDRPRPRTTAPA